MSFGLLPIAPPGHLSFTLQNFGLFIEFILVATVNYLSNSPAYVSYFLTKAILLLTLSSDLICSFLSCLVSGNVATNKTEAAQAVTSGGSKEAKIDSEEGQRTVSGNAGRSQGRGKGTRGIRFGLLKPFRSRIDFRV